MLVVGALAAGACGAQDPTQFDRGERPGIGSGKADDPQASTSFDALVSLLRTKGAITMPPLGIANAANELDATVTVHSAADVKAVASQIIREISASYAVDDPTGTLVDHYDDDVQVLLVSGWNEEAIQRDLLDMIAPSKRAAAAALLDGSMLHFRIYQTASEITAEEIFVYRPTGLDRAFVLRVSYVHA